MQFQSVIDDLARQGWALQENFISGDTVQALAGECRQRVAAGRLVPAGIGRAGAQAVDEAVRGDHIQWLEPGQSPASDAWLARMEQLRQTLNRTFFLGLEEFECHFAFYPPGTFYKTHLDRFRDDDCRTVTAVAYLNEQWQPADEGCMRMYLEQGGTLDIPPRGGTLVVFLSGEIRHEVLPTRAGRLSVTGWFRRRCWPVAD